MEEILTEVLLAIFLFLDAKDILRCERVCKRFSRLIRSNLRLMRKFEHDVVTIKHDLQHIQFSSLSRPRGRSLRVHVRPARNVATPLLPFTPDSNVSLIVDECFPAFVSLAVAEHLSVEEAIIKVMTKISSRFLFFSIKFTQIPFLSIFAALPDLFPDIGQVIIEESLITEEIASSLNILPHLEVVTLAFPQPDSLPFIRGIFHHPLLSKLCSFSVSWSSELEMDLDDDTLLSLRNMSDLFIRRVKTQVTVRGLRAFLDEFVDGKREIEEISLGVRNEGQTKEQIYDALHSCSVSCMDEMGRHVIRRQEGGATCLHMMSVHNWGSHWIVAIRDRNLRLRSTLNR